MMGHWFGNWGWLGMVINLVLTIGLIIGIVFFVIWIVKELNNNNRGSQNKGTSSAIEIAKERYAKGEISREEFQNLLTDLGTR
ncbi:MAG TPA: SHOCT domain-containing protein [Anaerolineaceae bacterium]|nr:SHOCT domain-containing protein [Anaerolineaceae bacterium]